MADSPYKLHVKIGMNEFEAEGSEDTVKSDYRDFISALKGPAAKNIISELASLGGIAPGNGGGDVATIEQRVLDRVFKKDGDIVSLRHLPTTATKTADAAILLIYGFMKLGGLDEVPITKLNEGLRESGLSLVRLDRHLGVHQALYRKGGQKSGGRFTLNNQGVKRAEDWLLAWD